MKKVIPLFFCLILMLEFQSCYIAKPLDHDVRISINSDFPVILNNTGNSNYLSKHTEDEYRKAYIDGLNAELKNDRLVIDNANPEYIVRINSLEITESTKMDTVKDVKSKENGMVRELTLGGFKTSGTVSKAGTNISSKWEAEKSKDEQLTNNRSLDQMIAGENKDNSVYREKSFDDNEFIVQSGHCGRRAGVRITKEVQSQLNK